MKNDDAAPRTKTVPDGAGRSITERDPIVALRERDTGIAHELSADRATFTIGTKAECDVLIANPYVSKVHCVAERRGPLLSVRDVGSHNGTFIDGARITDGEVEAGGRLVLAEPTGVSLLAMNGAMAEALPALHMIIGHHAHSAIDDLLGVALNKPPIGVKPDTKLDNIVIIGAGDCFPERLVGLIHGVSRRRAMPLVQLDSMPGTYGEQREIIERARRGTLALTLHYESPPIDNLARAMLFAPEYRVRVVLVVPSADVAVEVAGVDAFARMHVVQVRPLRDRSDDIDRLIDASFARIGSSVRFADFSSANQRALRSYGWPGNLPRVDQVMGWVHAIASQGSMRKAVVALGVKRSTFQGWLGEVGLTFPLGFER